MILHGWAVGQVFDLRHGDCVEGMRALETGSVDVAVTSPPYNLGTRYAHFRDTARRADFLEWSMRWGEELKRVLKPEGSFFLNIGAAPANPLLPHQLALGFSELFVLQNTLHWVKSITVRTAAGELVSAGHFKPINSPRFISDCHEYLFHFTKTGEVCLDRLAVGVPYADKSNVTRWRHTGGRDCRCRGNTWFVPYETIEHRAERPHPATFPVELAEMCLKLHGVGGQSVVLDPFNGIGHTALAAMKCGAGRFIGFDIDEGYLEEARARLSAAAASASTPRQDPNRHAQPSF